MCVGGGGGGGKFDCTMLICLSIYPCRVIVDGFSVFVVNPDGLISKHKIEQVMSSKNQNSIRNFIRRRIETLVPAKEPSLTQTDSN